MKRVAAAFVLAALAAGACADSSGPVPVDLVLSPTPSASALAQNDDPWAVPEPVTAAYVERVYAELARIESEAIRAYRDHVESGGDPALPPQAAVDRFRAIYSESYFPGRMGRWLEKASSGEGFSGFRNPLGQSYISVQSVDHVQADCVVAVGRLDLSETAAEPVETKPIYLVLVRAEGDSAAMNPTPWELRGSLIIEGSDTDPVASCAN